MVKVTIVTYSPDQNVVVPKSWCRNNYKHRSINKQPTLPPPHSPYDRTRNF